MAQPATQSAPRDADGIRARRERENYNLFARLPALYAASRAQGQKLLKIGGGLSIVEWRTLWDLHEVGPMTIRDLSVTQRADHSLLSRALPKMRDKGYVTMTRGETDGRQTLVSLTPAGQAAYDRAAPVMAKRRAALRETFSGEEIDQLVGFLDRFETFLRQPIDDVLAERPDK